MIDPIRATAIRTLYAQMHTTAAAAVVITVYMVCTAWAFTAWPVIVWWVAATLAVQLLRELLIRRFRRANPDDEALELWARLFVAHQILVGLVWGATMFLFAHPGQPVTVALTLCCLYSIAAGGVASQAYTPRSLYVMVGVLFTLVLLRLLVTAQFGYILLGVASALFAATMMSYCRIQSRAVHEGFRIRFENDGLVQALRVQKADADEARHRAELASLAKSQFLAAASHDLRQPLYALSLFSASLDELKLDAEGRGIVGNIQDSITGMESLFESLLDVSKLEAGVVQPRLAAVSVDELFDRLSQYFRPIAQDRGLDLRFRSGGAWVRSDGALLEQVLSNLVSNALRCTDRGGVLVAARARGEQVNLEVWDTGRGIPQADRQRIFEEFVQLGNPERDRRKGLGLGLSIARRAAALMDGQITVASRPGSGSRFTVSQPAAPCDAPALEIRAVPAEAIMAAVVRRSDLPLLIVDDDHDVRSAMKTLLDRWNLSFELVGSAQAALDLIAAGERYSLVLADYRLPGPINGLELIAAIQARHRSPSPATVLITGDFDAELLGLAHERGIPLLHKPVRAADLRTLLNL